MSRCSPRFETLLQTTRRTPLTELDTLLPEISLQVSPIDLNEQLQTEKQPLASKQETAAFKLPAQLRPPVRHHSFFRRQYSTQSIQTAIGVSQYISRRGRLLTSEQNTTPTFVAVARRYQLKGRAEARGRSSFTAHARWTIDTGSLDPRFLRFKSPRSRQYLIRLPRSIARRSDQEKLAKFLALRDLREHRDSAASKKSIADCRHLRVNRRYFYNDRDSAERSKLLVAIRTGASDRRRPSFLQARGARALQELSFSKLYNFPNRHQLTFLPAESRNQLKTPFVNASQPTPHRIIDRARSVLQHRHANKRTPYYRLSPDRVLRKLPFFLNPASKRAGRSGKKARSLLSKLEGKRNTYLRLLRFAPVNKKGLYQVLFTHAQRALQRAQNRLVTFKALQAPTPAAVHGPLGIVRHSSQKVKTPFPAHFDNNTFRYLASRRRFTKKCMRLQAARRATIFDTSRPRL